MLDELTAIASIGTARKAPSFVAMSPAIDDALAALSADSPEGKLLGAVAILSRYESCGRIAKPASITPVPAGEETVPACTRRAGELLGQILAMPNNDTKSRLADEWTELATGSARRAPHRLLPALLDYGAWRKGARRGIADVAGARGAWLMQLNPRWQFESDGREDSATLWSTGSRDLRVALLGRLRATDPAAARELIRSTWKEDAADDRSLFVSALIKSLRDEDEAFLESCLDDRSKQVRAAAADLLARLPRSAFVGRMIERADPLLKFSAAKTGGLLKKAASAKVEVLLPLAEFAAEWARDGIIEKPDGKLGRRQWWLQQLLAAVPPSHWSQNWNIAPAECIAAVTGEYAEVVLTAWHKAALRHPDPKWVAALLLAAAKEGRGAVTLELVNHLPNDARREISTELLASPRFTIDSVWQLLRVVEDPLDAHSTRAMFRLIERHIDEKAAGHSYIVTLVLHAAGLRVPPALYDELAQACTGSKWESCRKGLDEFFQDLLIRRDLQREFKP